MFRARRRHLRCVQRGQSTENIYPSGGLKRFHSTRVAVLYQALLPPVINNVRKPIKPDGYRDSGADIAYSLLKSGVDVVTPVAHPRSERQADWSFGDDEEGMLGALRMGATHIWANTILFRGHPLQSSQAIQQAGGDVCIVGQPPNLVECYDDKNFVNALLRSTGEFKLPRSHIVTAANVENIKISVPVVGKPIRGRGSHGVKLCHSKKEMRAHLQTILQESPEVMVEEFLSGQETTVTVMPPSESCARYWALPIVERYNHADGIAPYSGNIAITANSRAITEQEYMADESYQDLVDQCVRAAQLLRVTAPIRIDARRYFDRSDFALFDVNMKPNMTGPGRPGRDDQASLTALAAAELGWTYPDLLHAILRTSKPLQQLREMKPTSF